MAKIMNIRVKLLWYSIVVYISFSYFLSEATFNYNLITLTRILESSISKFMIGHALAFLVSSVSTLVFFYSLDKWNRQAHLAFFGILSAFVTSFLPINASFSIFLGLSAAKGIYSSILNIVPNVWVVELFQKQPLFYLQLLNVLNTLTYVFPPLIFHPLRIPNNSTDIQANALIFNSFPQVSLILSLNISSYETFKDNFELEIKKSNKTGGHFYDGIYRSDIWVPYQLVAFLLFLSAFIILIGYLLKPYEKPAKEDDEDDIYERGKRNLNRWQLALFLLLTCLVLGLFRANVTGVYSSLSVLMIQDRHSYEILMNCYKVVSVAIIAGGALNLIISGLSVQVVLFINFMALISANCLIVTMLNYNEYGLYVGVFLLAASNYFPLLITLVQERIGLTNKIMCILFLVETIALTASQVGFLHLVYTSVDNFTALALSTVAGSFAIFLILVVAEAFRLSRSEKLEASKVF